MSPASQPELEERIRAFLRRQLGVDDSALTARSALISAGVIDSVDLVRIASFLEGEAGLAIPDADISVENFDSIADMIGYVERRATSPRAS